MYKLTRKMAVISLTNLVKRSITDAQYQDLLTRKKIDNVNYYPQKENQCIGTCGDLMKKLAKEKNKDYNLKTIPKPINEHQLEAILTTQKYVQVTGMKISQPGSHYSGSHHSVLILGKDDNGDLIVYDPDPTHDAMKKLQDRARNLNKSVWELTDQDLGQNYNPLFLYKIPMKEFIEKIEEPIERNLDPLDVDTAVERLIAPMYQYYEEIEEAAEAQAKGAWCNIF